MTATPLTREQQIRLMKGAPERHAATIQRWKEDPEVQALVSASDFSEEPDRPGESTPIESWT